MKGDDISERLIDFAVRVLRLADSLPKTVVGKHMGLQLARAATAAGANYEEGRGVESRADFIHKLGIASKEARESRYWLKVIHRSEMIPPKRLDLLMAEVDELCAIPAKSISTAKRKTELENRETGS